MVCVAVVIGAACTETVPKRAPATIAALIACFIISTPAPKSHVIDPELSESKPRTMKITSSFQRSPDAYPRNLSEFLTHHSNHRTEVRSPFPLRRNLHYI